MYSNRLILIARQKLSWDQLEVAMYMNPLLLQSSANKGSGNTVAHFWKKVSGLEWNLQAY